MRGCRRHEPPDPQCEVCASRYARRLARTILATNLRRLFAVEFGTALSVDEFRRWRTAARNLIDHQRRECRWWRGVSMQVWLGQDGSLRGVASLDAITPEEFSVAFRRWPVSLRSIDACDLVAAVLKAVRPEVIAGSGSGGYQPIKFTIREQRIRSGPERTPECPRGSYIEPMPCLFA